MAAAAPSRSQMLVPLNAAITDRKDAIAAALPQLGISAERFLRVALTTLSRADNTLVTTARGNPASLVQAVLEAAQLGLTLDGPLGQAYLVPQRHHNQWRVELRIGAKGYVALAVRSGVVSHVSSAIVFEGDGLEYEQGTAAYLRHFPNAKGEKGLPTHVYAVAHLRSGGPPPFRLLTRADVERYRQMSASNTESSTSPWTTHWRDMWRKTAIRRLCDGKQFPLSAELQQAASVDAGHRLVLPATARVDAAGELGTGEEYITEDGEVLTLERDREPGEEG